MKKKLYKASYTIEASYTFTIVFVSILILIMFLYKEYSRVNLSFISHYNAVALANISDDLEDEKEKRKEEFANMVEANLIIGKINKSIEESLLFARARVSENKDIVDISISKYRPIFFMRLISLFDKEKEKKDEN